ncbi:glucosamine-6-phosphate deaminase [Nesterenkonia muleiensis]|uniref:glucosamine-6-phosphate deaminase n=1 Tax=Nesterenkonia muleiensis TaxID=2282648 RepID=UPI000E73EFDC|nr:glucosamine-6-phosphate deaminase [Nesterenkonia muleiensis]
MTSLYVVDTLAEGGQIGAEEIVEAAVRCQRVEGDFVLGVSTGSTPGSTWRALAGRLGESSVDTGRIQAFALDEYLDIEADHPESYRAVVRRQITLPLGLNPEKVRCPGDDGRDLQAPQRYEQAIRDAGGIDLQVLGIGRNGHIAFNEPGSSLASRCRVAALAEQTRQDNSRFFSSQEEVPRYCITQGIGTIMQARQLLLIAYGTAKAEALAAALEGPITAAVPASAIQLHPDVVVVADRSAASLLVHSANYSALRL